jgi:hypothetical protein
MTSEETLKALSEAVDAYASAKMANNEKLIRFAISNLQEFLNGHSITPIATPEAGQPSGDAGIEGQG